LRPPRFSISRRGGRKAALAAAVVAVAGTALLGGVLSTGGPGATAAVTPVEQAALSELVRGFSKGSAAAFVRKLEARVERNDRDVTALALLGFAYQQRARETADPTFFTLSERALGRADALTRRNSLVLSGLASLAASRHRFAEAERLARRALRADGANAGALAALGDALENLGRYRQAFQAFDRAAELSPSVATYGRVAHARELLGRLGAAAEALRLTLDLDSMLPEHEAWALVQLGNVELNRGFRERAADAYRRASRLLPGYVHARVGLARADIAAGRLAPAARRLQTAVRILPLPAHAALWGDTLSRLGRPAAARRAYALARAIHRLQAANGVQTDLQRALFDADHGTRLGRALRVAREAQRRSPSIVADDTLAWTLYRSGRCREAAGYSARALRLGTRDPLMLFHRGMIERCLGRSDASKRWLRRALDLNPGFSALWAPLAQRYAR
jgi:tetratricopeptide (TPR) repeat protein